MQFKQTKEPGRAHGIVSNILDAGYPESNEDSRIKEMFEMSLEMSNVRNFQSSTAQGGGESFKDRIAQVFR